MDNGVILVLRQPPLELGHIWIGLIKQVSILHRRELLHGFDLENNSWLEVELVHHLVLEVGFLLQSYRLEFCVQGLLLFEYPEMDLLLLLGLGSLRRRLLRNQELTIHLDVQLSGISGRLDMQHRGELLALPL